ncbi:MAG: hypothetical protein A2147_06675 [Chloroflexi bacterium RBG_16_57_8]|nr:MAG: hypothetical protein A2147_06675 [Chloroflexi bacterium RBG_16_57_8]
MVLGVPFLAFSPGYVLLRLIFPRKETGSVTTRLSLSIGLSIAVSVLTGIMLGLSPWGITVQSLTVALTTFIFVASAAAGCVRMMIGTPERAGVVPAVRIVALVKTGSRKYQMTLVALSLLALAGSTGLGVVLGRPVPEQTFTEFYLLGADGRAADYPAELAPGEAGRLMVGVVNHEGKDVEYLLEVQGGVAVEQKVTIRLKSGERWQEPVEFRITETGRHRVDFQLTNTGEAGSQTRYLWIDVPEQ